MCFDDLQPKNIIRQISALSQQEISPESTLLFLDEIQECPRRLKSMHMCLEEYHLPMGIKISPAPLQLNNNILSLPFYILAAL